MPYGKYLNRGKDIVQNNAGGRGYKVSLFDQIERFLILGAVGGTFYVRERDLVHENLGVIDKALQEDPRRLISLVDDVLRNGRSYKRSACILVLAKAASYELQDPSKAQIRRNAFTIALGLYSTDFFEFVDTVTKLRGWGKSLKQGVQSWYLNKDARDLSYQLAKYQQRNGRSHADNLRQSKPVPTSTPQRLAFAYATGKTHSVDEYRNAGLHYIAGIEHAKLVKTEQEIVSVISKYGLTFEMLPTEWLKSAKVWEALIPSMRVTAMTRNLGRLTSLGLSKSPVLWDRIRYLFSPENLKRERFHPMQAVIAAKAYQSGESQGGLKWTPDPELLRVLELAYFESFGAVEPTKARLKVAIDISGSMWSPIMGLKNVMAADVAGLMAYYWQVTHPGCSISAFTTDYRSIHFTKSLGFDKIIRQCQDLSRYMGGTDCALPIIEAMKHQEVYDAFIVITDNEHWARHETPAEALRRYRERVGLPVKMVVVATSATKFSVADPNDPYSLDVVGFDTSVPNLVADFIRA